MSAQASTLDATRKPRVFLSRTTTGLKDVADETAAILRERGAEVVIQTGFVPDWRNVPQMLQDKLIGCDTVIALIGPAHGGEPDREPTRLRDERTHGRAFSFTQWEYLVARDLRRPIFTFLVSGPGLVTPFEKEDAVREQRQRQFIADFAKDRTSLYYEYTERGKLLDHMEKIREADAVLCLVGSAYGFAPRTTIPEFRHPDTGREEFSYTQLEFLLARRLHKPVISILVPDAFCTFARPEDRGTPEQQQLQGDFIRDFIKKDEHVFHEFSSEADLLGAIRGRLIPIPDNPLPPPSPENIPFRSIGTIFTGRAATLRELREGFVSAGNVASRRPTVQLIHGTGGVGKTRLTVEFAHAHATDYTARLFVRGGSPGALDESLASLAGLFILNLEEQDEKETEVRIAAVLRWLAAHPGYLLVVDNVDTGEARDHAIEVLARLPAGHVLITSRLHTWPGDILRTPLGVLSDTDSRDLLLKYRSSPKAPAPDTDAADALALAHDLDGLALALEQAAAYLNVLAITIAEYHERWKTNAERVRAWHDPAQMGYPASVATTWLTSFEQLAAASQALLNLLSWLAPDPIPRFLLKPLAEKKLQPDPLTGTDPYKALGELIHFSLANPAQNGSAFTVHRLIQQVTRERQEPPSPVPALVTALDWLNKEMPEQTDDVRNWPVAIPLMPHAIANATFGTEHDIANPTSQILRCAAVFYLARSDYRRGEPLARQALAMAEARWGTDHHEVAPHLPTLARILLHLNRLDEAESLNRRALAIAMTKLGETNPSFTSYLTELGLVLEVKGEHAAAELLLRRALLLDQRNDGSNHFKIANRLYNLALILKESDQFAEAEPIFRRALRIWESAPESDNPSVAQGLNNLAQVLRVTGRTEGAEEHLRRALAINEKFYGDKHDRIASDLNHLGLVLLDSKRHKLAEPLFRRALTIVEEKFLHNHPAVAMILHNLGCCLVDSLKLREAEACFRRALLIRDTIHGPNHSNTQLTRQCLLNTRALIDN